MLKFSRSSNFAKRYNTVEVQLNAKVYSSFETIYINPVITFILVSLTWVGVRMQEICSLALFNLWVVQTLGLCKRNSYETKNIMRFVVLWDIINWLEPKTIQNAKLRSP